MKWDLRNEVKHFKVGDKVKTRGDMGGFNLTITAIHNNHFCTCKGYGKSRHFNMNVLQHRTTDNSDYVSASPKLPSHIKQCDGCNIKEPSMQDCFFCYKDKLGNFT